MQLEHRPYSYDTSDWQDELNSLEVIRFISEFKLTLQSEKTFYVNLADLSQFAVSFLTTIESGAFQQPMGESLVKSWLEKEDLQLFISQGETSVGFIVIDSRLKEEGVYYLDLAAVFPQNTGLGQRLLSSALETLMIAETATEKGKVLLARTQNPAMAMSLRKALKTIGAECFPIDRNPTQIECQAIKNWLERGHLRVLGDKELKIDTGRGIFYGAYTDWKPTPPSQIKQGAFHDYLVREGINFEEFMENGNALIVGGNLPNQTLKQANNY